jgi:methionyl-tRNA synthetase
MSEETFSQQQQKQYVTTTLPYVNGEPHLGHAFEFVRADAFARFRRLQGAEVFFNTGADEHGQKIYRSAHEADTDTQSFVDSNTQTFKDLLAELNISNSAFVRTTNESHKRAAQEFWRRCDDNGDIYKKEYTGQYCVGCELFVTESDLTEDGKCPHHPDREPEEISEENYFFRFSNYQVPLLEFYENNPDFVVPKKRFNEIKQFVRDGLEDFSISRQKDKLPWGVPVPGDKDQVMYVWFDALSNYISTLGWPDNEQMFADFWEDDNPVQFAGKDNLRQQSAMWQAMLMSAGFNPSKQIVIHGFIQSGGQKMSKSLGNVIEPKEIIDQYSTDVLRYFLMRHLHPFDDPNMTKDGLKEAYNGNLANGLGNTVSRIASMYASYDVDVALDSEAAVQDEDLETLSDHMNDYRFDKTMDYIWGELTHLDEFITDREPYKGIKSDDEDEVQEAKEAVAYVVLRLYDIAHMLTPFMPETAQKVQTILENQKDPDPLFERKE